MNGTLIVLSNAILSQRAEPQRGGRCKSGGHTGVGLGTGFWLRVGEQPIIHRGVCLPLLPVRRTAQGLSTFDAPCPSNVAPSGVCGETALPVVLADQGIVILGYLHAVGSLARNATFTFMVY